MPSALASEPLGVHATSAVAAPPSFEAVYEETFDFVWRNARRLGVSEAHLDDVAQEVFLTVHRRLPEFEGRCSVRTWVFAILLRVARTHRRSVRRKSPHAAGDGPTDPDTLASDARGPEDALRRAESLRRLSAVLDGLDDDKREIFVLAELERLSVPEAAEALGLNVNTAYARLRAARQDFEKACKRETARDERRRP